MAYTPEQIRSYVQQQGIGNDPNAMYKAAQQYGVTGSQMDGAMGWGAGTADQWTQQNGFQTLGAQPPPLANGGQRGPAQRTAADEYLARQPVGANQQGGAQPMPVASGYVNPQGQGGYPPGYNATNAPMYGAGPQGAPTSQQQYGYGNRPNQGGGYYEQQTPAGSFAAANQQRAGAYGANAYGSNNNYIGAQSQGIQGAPQVMQYAQQAQYANPYLGQQADRSQAAGKNAYSGENKYLQSAIDKSAGDMTRSFNNSVVPQLDRLAQQSGSFGNSGVQQMQGEAYRNLGEGIGNMSSAMRFQDYTTQQGLAEADLNRGQQNNQFNAGLSQNDIGRNLAGGFQQNSQNNGYFMDAAKFDASNNLNTQQFNSSLGNNDLTRNANLMQNQGQFNAGAQNTNSMFNAGNMNTNSMFNAGQGNNLNQYNAGAGNAMLENYRTRSQNQGQFDATLANNQNQFGQTLGNNRYQFDQTLGSNNRQFDATLGNNRYQFDETLDRNIYNDNMGWAQQGFNNQRGLMQDAYGYATGGLGAATNEYNTPMNYFNQFSGMANAAGGQGGTVNQSQNMQGNPYLGAIGGWNMFAPRQP
jgi:hypothetical protein